MKKFILGMCLSLLIACAPELRGGKGERCDELAACDDGFECYRGFCVVTESVSERDPIAEEGDAGLGQRSGGSDAGSSVRADASAGTSASAGKDASGAGSADDDGKPTSTPSSPAPAPVTGQPATMSDAGRSSAAVDAGQAAPPPDKKPAPPPTAPPAMTPSVPDAARPAVDAAASAPVDAAVSPSPDAAPPVVVVLPKNCTMQECCDEALRSRESSNGNMGKGGKSCGCNDPALVTALLGTLTCTLGGVVGGLL